MTWSTRVGLALLALSLAHPVAAQRRKLPASGDASSVRAELAAVLLQARRYEEAAREYRVLLARDPRNFASRLGLARALAWGKRPREAEQELRILSAQRPNDRGIDTLLRSVRDSMEPRSREAAQWLAERPAYLPYRRALARALVREGKHRAALPHYNHLLALDRSTALLREATHAHAEAGEHARAVQLLRGALDRVPTDTAVRHTLAGVLADWRQIGPALAQYDTLVARHPSSALLFERAQLNVGSRDLAAAEADVKASIFAGPTVGAYLLLGDLRRWGGDFAGARDAYVRARMLSPADRSTALAFAQLAREERPIVAFVPTWNPSEAWQLRSASVSDNAGISYATLGARRDVGLTDGFAGNADLELRRMTEQAAGLDVGVAGFALGLGVSREFARGPFLARLGGRGGVVYHTDGSTLAGAITMTGLYGPWGWSLERATGPAYPSLLTASSIRPPGNGEPLTEHKTSAAIGGPLSRADIAISVQRAHLSDDNRRSTVQAVLRYPLTTRLAAISSGIGIWFAKRSALYWDPSAYVASATGLEYATRQQRGLAYAARVLAGPARSVEVVRAGEEIEDVRYALQLIGSGELSYRSERGELGTAISYGSGRAGEYRRLEASVYARLLR
jgi:tetratricopeptide (TPR) repeat protein